MADPPAEQPSNEPAQPQDTQHPSAEDWVSVYEAVKDKPCQVAQPVKIKGLHRTRLETVLPFLHDIRQGTTLDEIRFLADQLHAKLDDLGVFRAVEIHLRPGEYADECQVFISTNEKGTFDGTHAGTHITPGSNDASMQAAIVVCNPTGRGEHVSLSAEYGLQSRSQFQATLSRKWLRQLPWHGSVSLLQNSSDWKPQSSYTELLRGVMLQLHSHDGMHQFQYELGWRVRGAAKSASPSIVAQCGHSLKSSLRHVYQRLFFPTDSTLLQLRSTTELAGLGFSSSAGRFAKQELSLRAVHDVVPGTSWVEGTLKAGVMTPWALPGQSWNTPTSVSDRFFLGGAGNLWGFAVRGAGPTDARRPTAQAEGQQRREHNPRSQDALGGDVYCTVTGRGCVALPNDALRNMGLHAQVFVQGGASALLGGQPRGVGLAMPFAEGRLELNLCHVLRRGPNDTLAPGIQFGYTTW